MASIEIGTRVIALTHKGQPHGTVIRLGVQGHSDAYPAMNADEGRAFAVCEYDNGASSIRWVDELAVEQPGA